MIRINLLAVERDRTKKRQATSLPAGQKLTLACSMILVATALGVGWWYWSLTQQASRIEEEIVYSQKETARLKSLIVQVQKFEERKGQLQQRVTLIEDLRKGQLEPVRLLDEISRSMPDMLWLTEVKQAGNELTITGKCTTLTALSDFVGNLEMGSYFKKPVEILDSKVDQQKAGGVDLITFSVKAIFTPPGA